jgi:tetratricopeptide (TPR) repeat protein
MKRQFVFTLIVILIVALGIVIIARASAPTGIAHDPTDDGYCESYGISIDSSQVEAIYLHPETLLANPEAFLNNDIASLMLAQRHIEINEPLDVDRWTKQIERIANLPMNEREQKTPYLFSREVITGKETFCKIAVPHILSNLPEGADVSTTIYQTALDSANTGFHNREGIVTELSHPNFGTAEKLFGQGSTSVYNIMVHELFHRGYQDAWLYQMEPPLENGVLRDFIKILQNDGMAVNAAYQIREYYPASLDFTYPLHNFELYVRYLIGQMNQVFDNITSKTAEELYPDINHLYQSNVHYIVGGYMAGRIEDQLGRDALVATVEIGPISFIQAYNSVAKEGLEIHFVEPENESASIYQDLRAAVLEGDLNRVRENLTAIQENPGAQLDVEVDGYLLYNTGYILLRGDHPDLAEDVFQLHIRLFPQVGAAYVGLGDVYAQRGNVSASVENYEKAMEMDPRNQWVAVVIHKLEYND